MNRLIPNKVLEIMPLIPNQEVMKFRQLFSPISSFFMIISPEDAKEQFQR